MRRCHYWLLVLLFACPQAKPQTGRILKDLRIEHLTTEQGLASNTVNTILQDNKGFIWFVTSAGLNRYDGHDFKFYGYSAKDLNSITPGWFGGFIDKKNGVIWLSDLSYKHLYSFMPASEKFTLYNYKPGPNNSRYLGIESDSTGTVWMATIKSLESFNPKTNKNHNYTHIPGDTTSIGSNFIQLEKDENGKIWLLVEKNNKSQIYYFDPYKGKVILHITDNTLMPSSGLNFKAGDRNAGLGDYLINIGKNGNLWIATGHNGLFRYNINTHQVAHFVHDANNPFSVAKSPVSGLIEDHSGNLWIYNSINKLDFYDSSTGKFYNVSAFNSAGDYTIEHLFEDNSGNIWIATHQDGVYTINPSQKKIHTISHDAENPSSLLSNISICSLKIQNGQTFLGTDKGITIFNEKTGVTAPFHLKGNKRETVQPHHVMYLYQDSKGTLWICAAEGLLSYNPLSKRHRWYRHNDNDPNSFINSTKCNGIIEDKKGRYWVTAWDGGFESFEPVTGKFRPVKIYNNNYKSDYPVGNLIQSSNGNIYIGSWGGGFVIFNPDTESFKIYRHSARDSTSLSSDIVFDCFETKNGIVWLCTNGGGLNAFDPLTKKFKAFTTRDGLCNNGVSSITADDIGNLWLGTISGISCFMPPDSPFSANCKLKFRNFNVSDGLPSNQTYLCTAYKAPDGNMYFGTYNKGFFYFNPSELKGNGFIPPVFITGVNIFNHPVSNNDGSKILSAQIEDTKEIRLDYKQNEVSFSFASLNYFHPEKNNYAYKLEPFDREWTFTNGAKHFADYTNLNPGTYVFRVKASNNDDIWNQKGASLKLIIVPPYWQTWWIKILCILGVGLIVYAVWYNRMQKSLAIKSIRNKIASNLHDDLGATLSSISIMSVLVQQQIKDHSPFANTLLEKIGSSSRNMIDSVNDMVWTINPKNDNFENIIKRMKAFAFEILIAKDIVLHFEFDKNLIQSKMNMDKRENFYLIFKEAINNSAKYSGAKNAFITILIEQNILKMTIRDDGNGFESNKIVPGNGLSNMQYRAESMKGTFNIASVPTKGTTIQLAFKNE